MAKKGKGKSTQSDDGLTNWTLNGLAPNYIKDLLIPSCDWLFSEMTG